MQTRTVATSNLAQRREFNRDFRTHLEGEHETSFIFLGKIWSSPIYKGKQEMNGGFIVKKECCDVVPPAGVLLARHPA
jgi:hypothetical protein